MNKGLFRDPAIERIPVISAGGEPLMPCKISKALSLLKSSKAFVRWTGDGAFYLQLKFDPKSPVIRSSKDTMESVMDSSLSGIWSVVPPTRRFIEGLWRIAQTNKSCLQSLSESDKALMEALLKARWREIKDPTILKAVTPIVKTMLEAFSEDYRREPVLHEERINEDGWLEENDMKVWGLIRPHRKPLENLFKRALRSGALQKVLGMKHRLYLKALLMASWSEIRSLLLLKILAPIVRKISEALDNMYAKSPLNMIPKSIIIKRGLERAESLLERLRASGIVKYAPNAIRWINSQAYRMWLGVTCAL